MAYLRVLTHALVIVGAVNWGLVGIVNVDLVAAIFGDGALLARLVYVLVGISGFYQVRVAWNRAAAA